MGHYFHLFPFITDERQAVFSRNFQEVSAQTWTKRATKFRLQQTVAMQTATDFLLFFNDSYLSGGSTYCLKILAICAPNAKVQSMYRT